MARRVGELVTVKIDTGSSTDGAPTTFLWRGRLYVVRGVLGQWRERRAWWTSAVARAVHGVGEDGGGGSGNVRTRVVLDHERVVWRVEASAGRMFGTGVYDLSEGDTPESWHLLRVSD
jgi:hypothetical protein